MALGLGTLVARVSLDRYELDGGLGAVKSNFPAGLGIIGGAGRHCARS